MSCGIVSWALDGETVAVSVGTSITSGDGTVLADTNMSSVVVSRWGQGRVCCAGRAECLSAREG